MFKRKLTALDYPQADNVNINDEKEFRKVIAWLEENKIKKYKPENRGNIRNVSSVEWQKSFTKYKQDLSCPIDTNIPHEELHWFLEYAVRMEYFSNKNKYDQFSVESLSITNTPNIVADNPLDHLDFASKDFDEGVKKLSELLKISPHPDPLISLKAISKAISNRLNRTALQNPKDFIVKGTPFPFQDADLGFDLGDPVLNKAAKILRLLYIQDLRYLQTKANELIVAVQNVTANPKTDTRLGKVGNK